MGRFADLLGTVAQSFGIGRATLDASGLTAARTLTLPDRAGTMALDGVVIQSTARSADFTFALTDANSVIQCSAALVATIPPHSSVAFPVGTKLILVEATGLAPHTEIAAGAGVTIRTSSKTRTHGYADQIVAVQIVQDSWYVFVIGFDANIPFLTLSFSTTASSYFAGWEVVGNSASAFTLTVNAALFKDGDRFLVRQGSTGQVTIAPAAGTTLVLGGATAKTAQKGSLLSISVDAINSIVYVNGECAAS